MRKRLLAILAGTSLALAISVISFSNSSNIKFDAGGVTEIDGPEPIAVKCEPAYNSVDKYYDFNNTSDAKQGIALNHVGDIQKVWDKTKGEGTRIAIIDSGIDYDHPDFFYDDGTSKIDLSCARYYANVTNDGSNHYTVGYKSGSNCLFFSADGKLTYSINGKSLNGKDVVAHNGDTSHGTNTASTAASAANPYSKTGCIGIAPMATIVPIKVDMYSNSILKALQYIHELNNDDDSSNNIDVVNISIVSYVSETFPKNYYYADVLNLISDKTIVVASAGNDHTTSLALPAADSNVIGVGALAKDSKTEKASYSNTNASGTTASTSNKNVEMVAPGSVYVADYDSGSTYKENSGTSFSSPIVAGAACLWKSLYKTGIVADFKKALYDSCIDIGDNGWDNTFGRGRIDIGGLIDTSDVVSTSSIDLPSYIRLDDVGEKYDLTPTISPSNATSRDFLYWSENESVATIDANGMVTAVAKGTAVVHCKSMQNDKAKDH